MSALEVAQIYTTIARQGSWIENHSIKKITYKNKTIYKYQKKTRPTIQKESVAVLVSMLMAVCQIGTAQKLKHLPFDVACKTGTTNDEKDAWFVGFTPEWLSVIWVGFDNPTSHGLTGASGALPIWLHFFKQNQNQIQVKKMTWPQKTYLKNITDTPLSSKITQTKDTKKNLANKKASPKKNHIQLFISKK